MSSSSTTTTARTATTQQQQPAVAGGAANEPNLQPATNDQQQPAEQSNTTNNNKKNPSLVLLAATTAGAAVAVQSDPTEDELRAKGAFVPIVLYHGGMGYNDGTKALLSSIGGPERIIEFTTVFYTKFHKDQHIKQFLGELHTPLETHGRRIGLYISEMMGAEGDPWSTNTQQRARKPAPLANGRSIVVDSRQAAHAAAWNSKTRKPENVGRRFKLDDCRVWMRLMFWACRETGLAEESPAFFNYFKRWVAHFIPVYEQTAAEFVRAEARWSLNPENIQRYVDDGCLMVDVVGVPYAKARSTLPSSEQGDDNWAYADAISA